MIRSRAMQRHDKVADRAGSLVTERVRGLIETAQARADRIRREAADEAQRMDNQRMEAAVRIVSQIKDLEGALGRLRGQMQAENAVEGSHVDEDRLIGAVKDGEGAGPAEAVSETATSTTAAAEVEPPAAEVEQPAAEVEQPAAEVEQPAAEVEQPAAEVEQPAAEVEQPVEQKAPADAEEPEPDAATATTKASDQAAPAGASEVEDDSQRSRFSFLRRREAQETAAAAPDRADEPSPRQHEEQTHACAVCGRGFAGGEDELKSLGWVVSASGDVTCADCHSAGWLRPSH